RFGPYVKHGSKYKTIPADESVLDVGMNRAVALLAEAKSTGRGRAAARPLRIVGNHPDDQAPIELYDGRYGPYVKHGGLNATVPRDLKPEELTLDQAVALLAERAAKNGSNGGGAKKPARAKKTTKAKSNGVAVAAPANDTLANDTEAKPKTVKKKSAPKRKAKTDSPPRTGTDG
ncbi:MAG TPA: topoisomerase C-terminal repeat-containing protein, partial [Reyranella sp.]|nr:topoisomerase C-terminal repeat-containing protein [Reyranella sp.]